MFAKVIDDKVVDVYPVVPDTLTLDNGSTVLGFSGGGLETQIAHGWYPVTDLTEQLNDKTHKRGEPSYTIKDNVVELQYAITPLSTEELAQVNTNRIAQLWQSATTYEQRHISGSANNLLVIGVTKSLPKAIAVQNWVNAIWAEYYLRKINTSNYNNDFSNVGSMPHSVTELIAEQS